MSIVSLVSVFLACYVVGCVNAGYYLVRIRTGEDVRSSGSGSAGARNVSRMLGRPGFIVTILFDAGKGAFAVWLARQFDLEPWAVGIAMIAVVAGHIWPAQLRFRGGKGMAPALGIGLMLSPLLVATVVLVAVFAMATFRHLTFSGLVAITSTPAIAYGLGQDRVLVVAIGFVVTLVLFAHRRNILEFLGNRKQRLGWYRRL
ncbi:MAG: glycerol-3-phosphate acyltransferase [Chloroflexi bacterium]|nr:glycerol-3-phosphate acyltransferase [Chloroflexota bacterium]